MRLYYGINPLDRYTSNVRKDACPETVIVRPGRAAIPVTRLLYTIFPDSNKKNGCVSCKAGTGKRPGLQ